MEHFSCDVLVVGGGGGALRAAIAAKERCPGANVLLATKGILGKSGVTATACSDRMAFHATLPHTPPGSTEAWRYHAEDIYRIGGVVSDHDLAEILAKNSEQAFSYLDNLGVPFVKSNGLPKQFVTDGSEYPRACYTGPRTAVHIEERLVERFRVLAIPALENCMVAKLVANGERVIGALALDTREKQDPKGALKIIGAKAIILATGGGGLIFKHNVFPVGMTGDGYALAYEVGAEFVNMEFIQIGVASSKTKLNCSGSMLRAVPRIIEESGREFLTDYFPPGTEHSKIYDTVFRKGASWPVSLEHDTHIIDVAIYQKTMEGQKVFLDYTQNPEGFDFNQLRGENQDRYRQEMVADLGEEERQRSPFNRLKEINPDSIAWLKEHGIDLEAGEKVEIAACGQHFQGGIKIRTKGETTVPGLYAVGEAAGGQHGANRPGGNALLDCQVFGRIAGEAAVEEALNQQNSAIPGEIAESYLERLRRFLSTDGMPASQFRQILQEQVEAAVGVVRTENGLKEGIACLESLKHAGMALDGKSLAYALENENMLVVAEMAMQAALLRDESRGPHLRFLDRTVNTPMPRRDPEWQQYIVITRTNHGMGLERKRPQGWKE